jgi:hypothetical protein
LKTAHLFAIVILTTIVTMGCAGGSSEKPLSATSFTTQWVKIDKGDYILISWTGGGKENPNIFDYNSDMTAFRYGSSEDSYNGTIYLYSMPTKGDNQPTSSVVVDPQRVCGRLSDLKLKAKTEKGWVDIPVPPAPKDMETVWGHFSSP